MSSNTANKVPTAQAFPVKNTTTTTTATYNQGDVEAQAFQDDTFDFDPDAGKGMGIAMIGTTITTLIGGFIPGIGAVLVVVSSVATIVLSSILTCGCCCAAEYRMSPKTKKFATATLTCVSLVFFLSLIYTIAVFLVAVNEAALIGELSDSTTSGVTGGAMALAAVVWILNILAVVFALLFTCGGPGCK